MGGSGGGKAKEIVMADVREMSEREVCGSAFDCIVESISGEDAEAVTEETIRLSKKAVCSKMKEVVYLPEGGTGSEGSSEDDLVAILINRSHALLSLGKMEDVEKSFFDVKERKVEVVEDDWWGEGGGGGKEADYDERSKETVSREAFIEFFLAVSEMLKFNRIRITF